MLTRLETARLQEFGNDGKPLVGGKLYFYQLQTTTPKATYQDIFGSAYNTNPVILDSVGSAEIYLFGSYTCSAVDQYGVSVGPPVDIAGGLNDFITSGSGNFATNVVYSVNTYADVRNLKIDYAWVFVQGRETQADGGQGLFYFSQDSSLDDDGITLTPQIPGSYIRYNIKYIDPRWFGLVYGGITSQEDYLTAAAKASERYGIQIKVDGEVYLNSNYTTSAYRSSWEFTDNSSLVSTLGITFSFTSGTSLLSCGRRVFKNNVTVNFSENVCDRILYSWFDADNTEGRIQKFLQASTEKYIVEFDEKVTTTQSVELPDNYYLDIKSTEDYVIYFNSATPLKFKCNNFLGSAVKRNVVKYSEISAIGTITTDEFLPISFWSPVVGDNSIAIQAAFLSGKVILDNDYYTSVILFATNVEMVGSNSYLLAVNSINVASLKAEDVVIGFYGVPTLTNAEFTRCSIQGAGSEIITTHTILRDSSSTIPFNGVVDCDGGEFGDYYGINTIFSSCNDTNFGELICSLSGTCDTITSDAAVIYTYGKSNINNYHGSDVKFNATGYLTCSNLNISASTDYNMCYGSGNITFNGCVFDEKITLSNRSRQVSANNCVGQVREYNTIINNIPQNNFYITSADITNNFIQATSGTKNVVDITDGFLSPVSGTYTYGPGGSALIRVTSASDAAVIAFKTYGGRIRVTTSGAAGSHFKIVLHRPNFKLVNQVFNHNLFLYNPGIVASGTYAETPYITDDSSKEFQVFCGINNINILNRYPGEVIPMWYDLKDYHNIRSQSIIDNIVNPVEGNVDVIIAGEIATGCKIKIELIAEVPKTQQVFETYYTQRKFPINTMDTMSFSYLGNPYYSSGNNGVSPAWIDCPKFDYIDDKLFISGKMPGVISARGDDFNYNIRIGTNAFGNDAENWAWGHYTLSGTTSATFHDNISINLDVYKTSAAKYSKDKPMNYNGWV